MKKRSNSTSGLPSNARAWLRGEKCGLFQFQNDDVLESLWAKHGDEDNFFWRPDVGLPITREDLEARENEWLHSGTDDEYGGKSFFIYEFYSDEEKRALWERGDHDSFYWKPGMRRPEAI